MTTRARAIRILTADSNQMSCRLLADALNREPGLSVVASACDYGSMTRMLQDTKPDIALISSGLPGRPSTSGPNAVAGNNSAPTCPWVLLVDRSEPQVVVSAFRAGAKGVFSRTQSEIHLRAKCIRRVVEGQVWVDSRQMQHLLDVLTGNENGKSGAAGTPPKLTRREESVVRLVVQGMVNREIANQLGLSEHTIKNYLFRIFDKLGVSNRVELALYAVAKLHLDECVAV